MIVESYEQLKRVAIQKYALESQNGNNKIDIFSLRELFANKINSPRMLSLVSDIASLIRILEKRGALSPVNIEALEYIYNVLKLDTDSEKECMPHVEESHSLLYNNINPHANDASHSNGAPHITQIRLPDRVVDTVCNQIGPSWKSLARYLKVEDTIEQTEITIKQIESITCDEERARMILNEYQRKANPSDLKIRLLKALKLASRMDIHDKVEKMLSKET